MKLKMKNIHKSFSGVKVLEDVDLEAGSGEVMGLVGINGAGKSTLMNIIVGEVSNDSGEIFLGEEELKINSPKEAEAYGISLIHQEPVDFGYMTVAENIFISNLPRGKSRLFVSKKQMEEESRKHLKRLGSDLSPKTRMNDLSMGQRQLVAVARALSQESKAILFDEPTSSLSIKERKNLFELIGKLKENGAIIIYITHFLDEVLEICDRVSILRDGKMASTGEISDYALKDIIREMIGKEVKTYKHCEKSECGNAVLEVKNLSSGDNYSDINFMLHSGEVLGIWGLMGAGRTEIIRSLLGLDPISSGEVRMAEGGVMRVISPDALLQTVGYVTETRHDDGLFLSKPVWWNVTSGNLRSFAEAPFNKMDVEKEKKAALSVTKQLNVKMPGIDAPAVELSGGNQQKAVLSKWLQRNPNIFFLDEPTRGVDVGAKNEIQKLIRQLASEGAAVLLVTSEVEEIMNLSDRIVVMRKGRFVKEVPFEDFSKEQLMALSVGEEST